MLIAHVYHHYLKQHNSQQNQDVNWLQKADEGRRTEEPEEFKTAMRKADYNSELTK